MNGRDYGDENDWKAARGGPHGYREPSKDELLRRDNAQKALWQAIARGTVRRRHWLARFIRWIVGTD